MTQLAWEIIMEKAPFMKQLLENKINEEVSKKQDEIDDLKTQIDILALEILTLRGI